MEHTASITGNCSSPCMQLCSICSEPNYDNAEGAIQFLTSPVLLFIVGLTNVGVCHWKFLRHVLLFWVPGVLILTNLGSPVMSCQGPSFLEPYNESSGFCTCTYISTPTTYCIQERLLGYPYGWIGSVFATPLIIGVLYSIPGTCMYMPHLSNIFQVYWFGSDRRYIVISSQVVWETVVRFLLLGCVFGFLMWIVYPFVVLNWMSWLVYRGFKLLFRMCIGRPPENPPSTRRALRDYFRPHLANNEQHAHFAGSVAMYEKRKKLIQLLSLFDLPVMTVRQFLRRVPVGFWPFSGDKFDLLWRIIIVQLSLRCQTYRSSQFIRLNVCGAPAAGKTTLKENLCMGKFKSFFVVNSTDEYKPTKAIDMGLFSPEGFNDCYRVFDMAGQEEYMPSHTFSLGHPHTVYLLLVRATDTNKLANARHWLSGICSCHNRQRQRNPPVLMVVSHCDQASRDVHMEIKDLWKLLSSDQEFRGLFQFIGDPFMMDCRKLRSRESKLLKRQLGNVLRLVVKDMPQPSPACTILRYHMRDIVRSLRRNIVTPLYFLRQAARVIFDEKAMLGFPPQMKAEFLRAMFSLEQSGEIVIFKVGDKLYVIPDIEWLLSLVNGRVFCPEEVARLVGGKRLHCNASGCTTLPDFKQCFSDLLDKHLILELFQKLEICYRTGPRLQELIFPSLIHSGNHGNYWPEVEGYDSMATCLRCSHPVQFSAGFFPKLQVRLHTMWKVRYGVANVPLFAGGVKLTLTDGPSPVDALVILAEGSFDTHIIVRARPDNRQRAIDLHQLLLDITKDVASAVSQGSNFTERALTEHSVSIQGGQRWSQPHYRIDELRRACENQHCVLDDQGMVPLTAEEVQTVVLPAVDDPAYLYRVANGRFFAVDYLDEDTLVTIRQLYPAADWRKLAQALNLSPRQISRVQESWKQNPDENNPVTATLELWMERNDCLVVTLRDVLRDLGFTGCAGFIQRRWEGAAV